MSNLKKVLAMVLAVAMLLSMGLTAGAGKFSDVKDTDDNARAINLLASLEVLKGFEDGTYNAAGTYTREQFAKILYVLMNGKDDGAAMYSGTSPFADVAADRWSAGYITWAKNAKVINGREDGLFWPTDIVTYAEAAKMFVVAMGYDSTVYTFPYGFIDKAQNLKLFEDVTGMTANGPATRGTVAQMAFNALFAKAPRFGTYAAQVGTSSTTSTETYTVAEGAFGMKEAMAQLTGTSTFAMGESFTDDGQVALLAMDEDVIDGVYDYDTEVDEYVGCKVAVWYKPAKNANEKDKIFDIQPSTDCKVYTFPVTAVDDDSTDVKLIVKIDGVKKTFKWDVTEDNGFTDTTAIDTLGNFIKNTVAAEDDDGANEVYDIVTGAKNSATKIKAFDLNGDNFIDGLCVIYADTVKVSSLDSTRITFGVPAGAKVVTTGSKNLKSDGILVYNIASDIAKSDYAIVTAKMAYTEEGMKEIFSLTKATKLEDVELTDVDDGDYIFDGTTYSVGKEATLDDDFTEEVTNVGNTYDLVLNANGKVVFSSEVTATAKKTDWILLMDYTAKALTDGVKLTGVTGYLSDGTKKTFDVASNLKVNGSLTTFDFEDEADILDLIGCDPDADPATYGTIYKFELNSDGEVKTLKDVATLAADAELDFDALAAGDSSYKKTTKWLTVGSTSTKLTEDSVVYFYDTNDDKYSVLDLSNIKSYDNGYAIEQGIEDSNEAAVLLMSAASKPVPSTDKFGFVISAKMSASSGDYVYTFKIAYDGKVESVKTDADDEVPAFTAMVEASNDDETIGFKKITFTSDGLVDAMDDLDATEMATIAVDESMADAITGYVLPAGEIDEAAGDVDYKLACKFDSYPGLEDTDYADDVNYYIISDYPVNATNGVYGVVDNDSAVEVASQDSISESNSDLVYVAVIFFDDDEVTDVFCFLDPVVNGTVNYVAP